MQTKRCADAQMQKCRCCKSYLVHNSVVEEHELGGALIVDAERRVDLLEHVAVPRQQLHCAADIFIIIAFSSCLSS